MFDSSLAEEIWASKYRFAPAGDAMGKAGENLLPRVVRPLPFFRDALMRMFHIEEIIQ